VKTLPAIREAVEERNWTLAQTGVTNTAATIERLASLLRDTTAKLKN
jgi:hypothetical protein